MLKCAEVIGLVVMAFVQGCVCRNQSTSSAVLGVVLSVPSSSWLVVGTFISALQNRTDDGFDTPAQPPLHVCSMRIGMVNSVIESSQCHVDGLMRGCCDHVLKLSKCLAVIASGSHSGAKHTHAIRLAGQKLMCTYPRTKRPQENASRHPVFLQIFKLQDWPSVSSQSHTEREQA